MERVSSTPPAPPPTTTKLTTVEVCRAGRVHSGDPWWPALYQRGLWASCVPHVCLGPLWLVGCLCDSSNDGLPPGTEAVDWLHLTPPVGLGPFGHSHVLAITGASSPHATSCHVVPPHATSCHYRERSLIPSLPCDLALPAASTTSTSFPLLTYYRSDRCISTTEHLCTILQCGHVGIKGFLVHVCAPCTVSTSTSASTRIRIRIRHIQGGGCPNSRGSRGGSSMIVGADPMLMERMSYGIGGRPLRWISCLARSRPVTCQSCAASRVRMGSAAGVITHQLA